MVRPSCGTPPLLYFEHDPIHIYVHGVDGTFFTYVLAYVGSRCYFTYAAMCNM